MNNETNSPEELDIRQMMQITERLIQIMNEETAFLQKNEDQQTFSIFRRKN